MSGRIGAAKSTPHKAINGQMGRRQDPERQSHQQSGDNGNLKEEKKGRETTRPNLDDTNATRPVE
jgi:hypothetical protein